LLVFSPISGFYRAKGFEQQLDRSFAKYLTTHNPQPFAPRFPQALRMPGGVRHFA
jgi:hypothetical protein